MSVIIGPIPIADAHGTHAPGTLIAHPSLALLALADGQACDPATDLPYARHVPAAAGTRAATPDVPDVDPEQRPEPTPDPGPASEPDSVDAPAATEIA